MVLIQFILPSSLWLFSFKSAISDQNQLMSHGVLAVTHYCHVMDVTAVSGFDGSSLLQNLVSIWHGHTRAEDRNAYPVVSYLVSWVQKYLRQ